MLADGFHGYFRRCTMRRSYQRGLALITVAAICASGPSRALAQSLPVHMGPDGRLVYERDERGDQVPDFSNCGYAGADRDIPNVPVRVTVTPIDGDDDARIQAAIDQVAKLPLGDDGFRGAVLLAPGEFQVSGQLRITASGVVLRGAGAGASGTAIVATGTDRRTLVRIAGPDDVGSAEGDRRVVDDYVPVGSRRLPLSSRRGLRVGERVVVMRHSTADWIKAIGSDAFGVGWGPGARDLHWDRVIANIDGNTITLDAPLTLALAQNFCGGAVG